MKRSTAPFGGTAPYWVQPPSVSRIAGPSSTSPETWSSAKWRSNSVEPTKSSRSSQVDQSPDSGSCTSSVSPDARLEHRLVAQREDLAGRAVGQPEQLVLDAARRACAGSSAPIGAAVIE